MLKIALVSIVGVGCFGGEVTCSGGEVDSDPPQASSRNPSNNITEAISILRTRTPKNLVCILDGLSVKNTHVVIPRFPLLCNRLTGSVPFASSRFICNHYLRELARPALKTGPRQSFSHLCGCSACLIDYAGSPNLRSGNLGGHQYLACIFVAILSGITM